MNSQNQIAEVRPSWDAKALAVVGLATFWAIPFSPLVTIAALKRTEGTDGWARRLSVAAAVCCAVYAVAMSAWIFAMTVQFLQPA